MEKRCHPFNYALLGKGNTSAQPVMADVVPLPGMRIRYKTVVVTNVTRANSDADIGIGQAGRFTRVYQFLNIAQNAPTAYPYHPFSVQGEWNERLEIRWADTQDGDELRVELTGEIETAGEV